MRCVRVRLRVLILAVALVVSGWVLNLGLLWHEEAGLVDDCRGGRVWGAIDYLDATGRRPDRLASETLRASIRLADVNAVRKCMELGIRPDLPIWIGGDLIDRFGRGRLERLSAVDLCEVELSRLTARPSLATPGPESAARRVRLTAILKTLWAAGGR